MDSRFPTLRLLPRILPLTVAAGLMTAACQGNTFFAPMETSPMESPTGAPGAPMAMPGAPMGGAPMPGMPMDPMGMPMMPGMPPMVAEQEVDLIDVSHKVADALVGELRKNHPSFHRRKPLIVASFVDRNDLDSSSELGLLIADHVSSRITQQGYAVVEPKLRKEFAVRIRGGEFALSRDVEKLSAEFGAHAMVVGSYTRSRDMLDFTARIIQTSNQQVLASIDAKLPLGTTTRDLLVETGGPNLKVVDQ
ncbi:MAG: hypothetical protein HQL82_03475 [Magnetococcales bacterium]|nr:hypothetical protein [Magnetococcales bacterium]